MFINNAYAEVAPSVQGSSILDFLPLIVLVAVFYFFILRPQAKRAKDHKAMVSALQRGDEVVTSGGQVGRISKVYEEYAGVEFAENVEMTIQKSAIQSVLPKGTIKSIK